MIATAKMAQRHVAWIGCVLFALPLVAHAYAGTASRYVSDDYCAGYIFHDYGLIGGQRWFYMNWGAVPTTLLLMALTEPVGVQLTPVLAGFAIVAWIGALTWAIQRITDRLGDRWTLSWSLLMAEVIVYATLQDSPNVIQSLYLRIPMFEYVLPLVALASYIGWLARASSGPASARALLASGVITFVAGSLGPVYVVLQTTLLAMGAMLNRLVHRVDRSRALERLLIAGAVGSAAALALVALAPGNAARQLHFAPPPGVAVIATWSTLATVFMFARPLLPPLHGVILALAGHVFSSEPPWLPKALGMATSPLTLLAVATVAGAIGFARGRAQPRLRDAYALRFVLVAAPIVAFVLVAACMAPSVYGTSAPPPPRALIQPEFVLVCAVVCWTYAAAFRRGSAAALTPIHRIAGAAMTVLVCVVGFTPVASAAVIFRQARSLRQWAAQWDEVDRQIRAARARGEARVEVTALDPIGGVMAIGQDPADWVNTCAAKFYGLEAIVGSAKRP